MAPRTRRAKKSRRAIVGIEAAIVLIAFVIVASALAFVALNMGFYTTQKSKEVISTGLGQASSALEIDGTILAYIDTTNKLVEAIAIPMRLAPGKEPVDLTIGKTTVSFWAKQANGTAYAFADIYAGTNHDYAGQIVDLSQLVTAVGNVDKAKAIIFWITQVNNDDVLDYGEKVVLIVKVNTAQVVIGNYSTVKVEVKPPVGAALTVERSIPPTLTTEVVDLG